jgi:hypothetical protein
MEANGQRHRRQKVAANAFFCPRHGKAPPERGFPLERLKGFEPSTFCMASRRSSQLSYSRIWEQFTVVGPIRR